MNGGNESLLVAVREAILIADIYSELATTSPADRLTLLSWRRELLATAFMAVALRSPAQAVEMAVHAVAEDPRWLLDLFDAGVGCGETDQNKVSHVACQEGHWKIRMSGRRIRVLHLIDNLDLGGAQNVLFGMLECFDRSRFEIVLATMHAHQGSIFFGRAQALGVRVVPLSPRRWFPWYFASLPWLLIRGRFDVVHCHLYVSNWLGKPLAKLFGCLLLFHTIIVMTDFALIGHFSRQSTLLRTGLPIGF